jgi:hypothetical protein
MDKDLNDILFRIKQQQELIKQAQEDVRNLDKVLYNLQADLYTHMPKEE